MNIDPIVEGILKQDYRSISRAITLIEDENTLLSGRELIKRIYSNTGKARVTGITGPPGVGKSTIIGHLAPLLKREGNGVAILAIDASSPFTMGSLLGNRIRMQPDLTSSRIFMRSLSTRGATGGLSRHVWDAVRILDAAGFSDIIIETVGAGQADLDILQIAQTIIVVLAPGLGDQIQAIKAGLMEIASIFIINKTDRDGAMLAIKDIEDSLMLAEQGKWKIPVIGLDSIQYKGYDELVSAIKAHKASVSGGVRSEIERYLAELKSALRFEAEARIKELDEKTLSGLLDLAEVAKKKIDPYTVAEEISSTVLGSL